MCYLIKNIGGHQVVVSGGKGSGIGLIWGKIMKRKWGWIQPNSFDWNYQSINKNVNLKVCLK